jgi:hypothetical protein
MELLKKLTITPLIAGITFFIFFSSIAILIQNVTVVDFAMIIVVSSFLATGIALCTKDDGAACAKYGILLVCNIVGVCIILGLGILAIVLAFNSTHLFSIQELTMMFSISVSCLAIIMTVVTNITLSNRTAENKVNQLQKQSEIVGTEVQSID